MRNYIFVDRMKNGRPSAGHLLLRHCSSERGQRVQKQRTGTAQKMLNPAGCRDQRSVGWLWLVIVHACMPNLCDGSFVSPSPQPHNLWPTMSPALTRMELVESSQGAAEDDAVPIKKTLALEAASALGWEVRPMAKALGAEVTFLSPLLRTPMR